MLRSFSSRCGLHYGRWQRVGLTRYPKGWIEMTSSRALAAVCALFAILVFLAAGAMAEEAHEPAVHEYHVNHFGGVVGGATHLDTNESGLSIGLEYARQFNPRWAAVSYLELTSGTGERDVIISAGVIFYPTPRLGLIFGPGIELVEKDVNHHGEIVTESEAELMWRIGAGYGFPLGEASIGPAFFADYAGDRWTIVYGIAMVTGF